MPSNIFPAFTASDNYVLTPLVAHLAILLLRVARSQITTDKSAELAASLFWQNDRGRPQLRRPLACAQTTCAEKTRRSGNYCSGRSPQKIVRATAVAALLGSSYWDARHQDH